MSQSPWYTAYISMALFIQRSIEQAAQLFSFLSPGSSTLEDFNNAITIVAVQHTYRLPCVPPPFPLHRRHTAERYWRIRGTTIQRFPPLPAPRSRNKPDSIWMERSCLKGRKGSQGMTGLFTGQGQSCRRDQVGEGLGERKVIAGERWEWKGILSLTPTLDHAFQYGHQ